MPSIPPPLFAFGFSSPWLLGGLVLGGLPIIIHLLHKRKYRESDWAAMQFLLEAARKNSRRIRLEQLLLLLIRVLILLLVALALSQPYVESLGTFFAADAPTHRIIVIDSSFSMAYRQGDRTQFERAKTMARRIVISTKQGDALGLVRISGLPPVRIVKQPAFQQNRAIDEIENLQVTDEHGDLLASLREIDTLLRENSDIANREIFLISDFQRSMWSPESPLQHAQIRGLLKTISERARLNFIDPGQAQSPNTAVTDFSAAEQFVMVGRPIPLTVKAHNYGHKLLAGQVVELYVDGKLTKTATIDLPPRSEVITDFHHAFETGGEHHLRVRLPNDALTVDNQRSLSLPAKSELNLLLVDGAPAGRPEQNATFYLQTVLSPSTSKQTWSGFTQPFYIKEGELSETDLSRFDCVFLCNVGLFEEREVEILRAYVERGGALVVCLGDRVRPENYNRMLYRDGKGLLPAKLKDRIGNARNPQVAYTFETADLDHPIVQPFQGNPGTGLETTLTYEYFRVEVPSERQARSVLTFDSKDPAIVEAPYGHGRVILFTTSVDDKWSTWARFNASFVPIIYETVRFGIAGRWKERNHLVGEPIMRTFPAYVFNMPVEITLPDGDKKQIPLVESDNVARIAYEATTRHGVYEVSLGHPLSRVELFAVNVDPRESDLEKVSETELREELFPGIEFTYRTDWQERRDGFRATGVQTGGSLTRWLLLVALCLLFVEQLMAWRFLYGFLLLYGLVAMAFVQQTFAWHSVAGALVFAVVAIGFWAVWKVGTRTRLPGPSRTLPKPR